jgi:nucleoside-diphosphate-sugar epimerase
MSGPIVVTGASGFIGTAVTAELNRRHVPLVPLSRSGEGGTQRVKHFREAPAGGVLIHLAEEARIDSVDAACAKEQEEVLAALIGAGFSRIVYVSSGAVYGDADARPRRPDDPTIASNPYLAGKLACERRACAIGGAVARLANVYGPGMSRQTVLGEILRQLHREGPVLVHDLAPIRDFIWIEDVARGLVDLALSTAHGVFNFGTGIGTGVSELIQLALGITGERDRTVAAIAPSGRASALILDAAGAREAFGWQPQVSLAEGLNRVIVPR